MPVSSQPECMHAACACLARQDGRYCGDYCREAHEAQIALSRRDPGQLRATGHACGCGHAECEERVKTGQAMHEQAR
jgi:hypothetical protein